MILKYIVTFVLVFWLANGSEGGYLDLKDVDFDEDGDISLD